MSSTPTNLEARAIPAASPSPTFPPPSSPSAAPSTSNDRLPPALTVRLGVMRRILLAVSGMDGHRRWRFAFTTFVGAAQVIAFIVILGTSYHKPCDQNLGLYLILLIVRIALAFPTALWSAITPRHSRRDTPERRQELESNRLVGNHRIDRRFKKVADLISLYGLIVFLVGNIWIISSDTCEATNPTLYRGALAGLILSWIWILEFFILCAFAIFCLPILLYGIRHWGWGQKKHEVGGLKKSDISKLPRRIFTGTLGEESSNPSSPSTPDLDSKPYPPSPLPADPATPRTSTKSRKQWWRLYKSSRSSTSTPPPSSPANSKNPVSSSSSPISQYPPFPPKTLPIQLPESQNACSICLSEYEIPPLRTSPEATTWEPEILLLLPCGHAFHETCLGDWLAVSGRCALCQAPVFPPKEPKSGKPSAVSPSSANTTTTTTTATTTTASPAASTPPTNDQGTQTGAEQREGEEREVDSSSRDRVENMV